MCKLKIPIIAMSLFLLIGLFFYTTAHAGDCEEWVAKIVSIQGEVMAKRAGEAHWSPARFEDTFCPGDMLRGHAHKSMDI